MGSLEKKLKKQQLRKQYETLCKSWSYEKKNNASLNLGKKPTFNQYVKRLEELAEQNRIKLSQTLASTYENVDKEWQEQ